MIQLHGKNILNRAFGGSTLEDVTRWRYDVVFPYEPKKILMYCGENDFANNDTLSVQTVFNRFTTLFQLIRARYPKTPFIYVSMKPSPSRKHLMPKFNETNNLIKNYLSTQKKTAFADVYNAMLTGEGKPEPDIFLEDQLHMNAKGYAIWQKILKRYF